MSRHLRAEFNIPVGLQDINDSQEDEQFLIFMFCRNSTHSVRKSTMFVKVNLKPFPDLYCLGFELSNKNIKQQ